MRLRRAIHREPELGLGVPRTQAKVLDELRGLPLDIRTGQRPTSVVADLQGNRPGRAIVLRADMDALPLHEETGLEFASRTPGRMHACGHDATPRWAAGTIATRPGPVLASSDTLTIVVRGRGGHASAPHMAADPVPVACESSWRSRRS